MYTLCHRVSSRLKWSEMKKVLHKTKSHQNDKIFVNLNSTITYPSFELFECTGFIHVSWMI
jgi:hypothetical protein